MENQERLDRIRRQALDRIDRAESRYKWAVVGTALLEAFLLILVFLVTDFEDPQQRQVLICSLLVYFTLAMALIALGTFVARIEARVLKSIELLAVDDERETAG